MGQNLKLEGLSELFESYSIFVDRGSTSSHKNERRLTGMQDPRDCGGGREETSAK